MGRVVLVTGVSRYLGGLFARVLSADEQVDRIIGVDVVPPPHDIGRSDFVRADIRNPVIAKVIATAGVDTVVHMNVIATPTSAGGRVSMKEINVIGTMQLLAACQKAPGLRRLVVKSTSSVYGASPRDPALFTEDTGAKVLPRSGWGKDSVEVEGYVRGFARRRPDVTVSMLRFANIMGPGMDTPLTRYFSLPVVPTVLGFDGRLQLAHEDDALEVLRRCTFEDHHGTFNVAGDGVLLLSQAVARAGRANFPLLAPLAGSARDLSRRLGIIDLSPEYVEFLKYGRVVDTTRVTQELDWQPEYSTLATFDDFVASRHLGKVAPVQALSLLEAQVESQLSARGGD